MAELMMSSSGPAGRQQALDAKISSFRTAVLEHDDIPFQLHGTMNLRDAKHTQGASGTTFSPNLELHGLQNQSDADDSTSYSSSSDSDYRGNSIFFSPLPPPISGARSRSRPATFAARLAKMRHNTATTGIRAAVGGGGEKTAVQFYSADASPPLRSPRSLPSFATISDTESHLSDPGLVYNMRSQWTRLRDRRINVLNILDEIRMKRSDVQDIRYQKDKTDDALFLAVRTELYKTNPAAMEQYLQAAERIRLLYQDADQKLEDLLDELKDSEVELEILERRFYSQLASEEPPLLKPDGDSLDEDSRPPSRNSLRGITRDRPENFHPLYEEMREAFRELQLAKEYLHNLAFKRLAIEAADSHLGSEATEFLRTFDETERMAKSKIDYWTARFDEVQGECRERRLVPTSTPFYEDDDGYHPVIGIVGEDISLEDVPAQSGSPKNALDSLAHPYFPILLNNPKHLLADPFPLTPKGALREAIRLPKDAPTREKSIMAASEEYSISTLLSDARSMDKNDYINRWLLQNLRVSAIEAEVLYSTFRTVLRIIDRGRWQRDVLLFWSRDEAAKTQGEATTKNINSNDEDFDPKKANQFIESYALSNKRADSIRTPDSCYK